MKTNQEFKLTLITLVTFLILTSLFTNCQSDDLIINEMETKNNNSIKTLNKSSNQIGDRYYNSGSSTSLNNSNWMSQLPDSKRISEISIPGTHDTAALYGGHLSQCQSMSIEEQLKAGIRFFDIRCGLIDNVFYIYHGIFYQGINFGDVLNKVRKFLSDNPTETVFMRVKQENSKASDQDFKNVFDNYISKHGRSNFYAPKASTGCNYPRNLGKIRGKIAIIENVSGLDGIPWNCLKIQDDYHVPTIFARWSKYLKVQKHLEDSDKDKIYLYLNFSSGTSALAYPYTVASHVNYYLLDYLKTNNKIKTGIVAMDFPGDDLIQSIINRNF